MHRLLPLVLLSACLGSRAPADAVSVSAASGDASNHPDVAPDAPPAPLQSGACAAACRTDDDCGADQVCDTPENANAFMAYRWFCVSREAPPGAGFQSRSSDAQARTFEGVCKGDADCPRLTVCTLGRPARICRSRCHVDSDCNQLTQITQDQGVCVAGRCEKCDPGRPNTCDPSTECRFHAPPDYGRCAPRCGTDGDCRGSGLLCVGAD